MTRLDERKTRLSVEFSDAIRHRGKLREIIMTFRPYNVTVRLKGTRKTFEVSPASIFNIAVLKEVERQKAEKKARRK